MYGTRLITNHCHSILTFIRDRPGTFLFGPTNWDIILAVL